MADKGLASHCLVVGGTGMLAGVSRHLLKQFDVVSVVARSDASFDHIFADQESLSQTSSNLNRLIVDYTDIPAFQGALRQSQDRSGPIQLAVAWIHSTSPQAPITLAEVLGRQSIKSDYIDIVGSASANPLTIEREVARAIDTMPRVAYRKVVLGHVKQASGQRWLTHEEISVGVIDAIESGEALTGLGAL